MSPTDIPLTSVAASQPVTTDEALAQAQADGARVEVTAARSETDTVWANPEGTLTRDISGVPVRAMTDAGWAPLDLTLHREGDRIVAGNNTVDVSFSAGGDNKLVSVADDGNRLSLGWESTLPAPSLEGDTAVYADVMPDVDLLMRAVPGGYTQVFRVNTPAAAKSEELKQLDFTASTSSPNGLQPAAGGGFTVRDASGDVAFQGQEPTMWDSSGTTSAASEEANASTAQDGDDLATMPMSWDANQLVVEPEQELLTDPSITYPVFIDPHVVSQGRRSGRWCRRSTQHRVPQLGQRQRWDG